MIVSHAGELSQRIDIYERKETKGQAGGLIRAWKKKVSVWGKIRPLTARERIASDRVEGVSGYHVLIRTRTDVDETDSLVWRDRRHNIRSIKERAPRSLYMEVETEVGVAV